MALVASIRINSVASSARAHRFTCWPPSSQPGGAQCLPPLASCCSPCRTCEPRDAGSQVASSLQTLPHTRSSHPRRAATHAVSRTFGVDGDWHGAEGEAARRKCINAPRIARTESNAPHRAPVHAAIGGHDLATWLRLIDKASAYGIRHRHLKRGSASRRRSCASPHVITARRPPHPPHVC